MPVPIHLVAAMTEYPNICSTQAHSEERRLAILHAIREQGRQLGHQLGGAADAWVICGGCHNVEVDICEGYRCLYCEVVFCRVCASVHFGPDSEPPRDGTPHRVVSDGPLDHIECPGRGSTEVTAGEARFCPNCGDPLNQPSEVKPGA